ncbi:MAG: aminotransferase class V-fold PLP-dependent enzyme [Verrucomicrobiales bacterium]|jgi:cysteine desulfurase|nr:aminotransferase class V-fold PLP-dependent enzyme [Verrucomicrobiales bacterium]
MNQPIYFDNNATTAVSPSVFEAMVPYLTEHYGNASSAYRSGRVARAAVERAREQVADLLGCEPREVVFTGCATESDNAAISSALHTTGHRHVIVSAVEHSAIKNHAEHLERLGYGVTFLPVAGDGTLTVQQVAAALRPDTAIVSVMWANNETGVLFPVAEIGELCRARGVLFHTDAVQVVGKLPVNLAGLQVDFLSLSGHKFHAPKGVGALYVRRRAKFVPYLIGGHQEKGKRGGTENVPHLVGLGQAAVEAKRHLAAEAAAVLRLRDKLEHTVLEKIPDTFVNGHRQRRTPNTSSLAFAGLEAEALLLLLDQHNVSASAGSACTTGAVEISHVLKAMGVPPDRAVGTLRFSLSARNTEAEVDYVLGILPPLIAKLRAEKTGAVALKAKLAAGEKIV